MELLQISPQDNVAVALRDCGKGYEFNGTTAIEDIRRGHKMALVDIPKGGLVVKYGYPIGKATSDIPKGSWVHVHNTATRLSEETGYKYIPAFTDITPMPPRSFSGFLRTDGRAGVRNEIWIIPTVGCVNGVAGHLASKAAKFTGDGLEGVYAFPHPYGCSQMGDDHIQTRRLLASLVRHPNAGGVLVLGLGCENNVMSDFKRELGAWDPARVKFLVCQEAEDEIAEGLVLIEELAEAARADRRQLLSAEKLVIGMKCGGSDGLSGLTANPVVGRFSDMMIAQGAATILTEIPEMFGAEDMLFARCADAWIFDKAVKMVEGFKDYYTSHGQVVYENPSPGNKDGGITTLEDKSLGCVQKGGTAPIVDVLDYGQRVHILGLNLLNGPGNDLVSATAMTAAGAHIILFTTGRGTPFGAPAPTIKISTNNELYNKKRGWMDFNAGTVVDGETIDSAAQRLMELVMDVASGVRTTSEHMGYREISIFKNGVTL